MAYWAATRLEAHRENKAEYFLQQFGYETYLPKVRWRHKRKRTTRVLPLFPGYLFTRIELQWRDVCLCPGVIKLVMDGDHPARVPDEIIDESRGREHHGAIDLRREGKRFKAGDRVQIVDGLLAGGSADAARRRCARYSIANEYTHRPTKGIPRSPLQTSRQQWVLSRARCRMGARCHLGSLWGRRGVMQTLWLLCGAHLFILVGPRGSQIYRGMRQWSAMRGRRHRVTSVEPAPTRGAPDELVSVVWLLRGFTTAYVGHISSPRMVRSGALGTLTTGPVPFQPSLSARGVPKASCKHTGQIPFRSDRQCARPAKRSGGSVAVFIRATQE